MTTMSKGFSDKATARDHVWDRLQEERAARFPFPPHGRIPNFAGAREAAERLLAHPVFEGVRRIKANPDAPQRHVRELAFRRGIVVFVPTPHLRGGFKMFDPEHIPEDKLGEAATLSKGDPWARDVELADLPPMDLVVTGCVAVTRGGRRCGKGHGYGDIEYAILRELGHPAVAVVTTVHPLQVVADFPADTHDLPVSVIATPEEIVEVENPPEPPAGIDWAALPEDAFEEMPVLAELDRLRRERGRAS